MFDEALRPLELDLGRRIDLIDWFPRHPNIRILVVVDAEIGISESGGFGVGRVIKLLRETNVGCTSFQVDVAVRDSRPFGENQQPDPYQPHYVGFRFDSIAGGGAAVVNQYHELFLFGFKPSNSGSSSDQEIDQPQAIPASDAELAVLERFMREGKGGVFGTGDHHFLGASMCRRIPRLGTMRKWTNKDGVPTIGGKTRIDTNQPFTPSELDGSSIISTSRQGDAQPQPIEWVVDSQTQLGFTVQRRPHPILCHPTHGPIDVMPDHAHEGLVNVPADIDFTATYDFGSGQHREYPNVGSVPLQPKVIAWGRTVPDPPFMQAKGAIDPLRFPMISVYDGHRASVGRVVTDSTWHHWFNVNITGIEAAADKTHWDKISRFFVDVATWLAPPGVFASRCWWEIPVARVGEFGLQEYAPNRSTLELGQAFRTHLTTIYGVCWVREFVLQNICDLQPKLCEYLRDREVVDPRSPVCLSCPPWEVIEAEVLGGMVKGSARTVDRFLNALDTPVRAREQSLATQDLRASAQKGAAASLTRLNKNVSKELALSARAFAP